MIAEMLRDLGQDGVEWLHVILNKFFIDERLPEDLKESEIVTIYKQKGDALECGNYRGIKLLEIHLKVYERAIERRIRERVIIHCNQFGFIQEKERLMPSLSYGKYKRRFWKEMTNDTGPSWIWRRLLIEFRGR